LANDLDIRALHRDTGQLIRKFVVDATRDCNHKAFLAEQA
jgi:hypothetical protein